MDHRAITINDVDRCRLGTLLTCTEGAAYGRSRSRFDLEAKLEGANAVPVSGTPRTLVTMNSTVVLVGVDSDERRICRLVYPEDRDLSPRSVGVLQPLGQCILGRSVGDIVQFNEGTHLKRYRIESIPFQPEAEGASHL
jgi:transcription elongation GreA/GreB family factor